VYTHVLTWIDCSNEARREVAYVAQHFTPITNCRVTLVAVISPSQTEAERAKKLDHALGALRETGEILHAKGIFSWRKVLVGKDPIAAVSEESRQTENPYDLIVVGTHQMRLEDIEPPCFGSPADRLAQRVTLPLLVVPDGPPMRKV
jgi:nucleotide-binding universal stress UspA family protein